MNQRKPPNNVARLLFLGGNPSRPRPARNPTNKPPPVNRVRDAAIALQAQLEEAGLGSWEHDRKYLLESNFRGDLVYRRLKIVVEVQGGVWGKPVVCNHCGQPVIREVVNKRGVRTIVQVREGLHHTRGAGATDDIVKHNLTVLAGWVLVYVTTDQIKSTYALDTVKAAIELRYAEGRQ